MSLAVAQVMFSLLAVAAGAAAVLLLVARLVPAARPVVDAVAPSAVWLAWLVAAASTVGSLVFSEVYDLLPCRMCWFQRICMYPLSAVLLVGALRRDRAVRWYALPMAITGVLLATWHVLMEWHPQLGQGSCDLTVPCTVPYFREFGFVTIAFMALCGFALITVLLTFPTPEAIHVDSSEEADQREATPVG